MKKLQIKRIYERPCPDDGIRILVDRLWPRGIKKVNAHLDYWFKDIAPSAELRIWFAHKAENFEEFSKRYTNELKNKENAVNKIKDMLKKENVALIYAAKDSKINHAIVLKKFMEKN